LFDVVEREHGADAAATLRGKSGFDLTDCPPMLPVPFHVMNSAFNIAAQLTGDALNGARIGRIFRPEGFAPFAAYALASDTLAEVIARSIATQPMHSSAEALDLQIDGRRAHWQLRYRARNESSVEQVAQRTLMLMLGALLRYAGPGAGHIEVNVREFHAADALKLEQQIGVRVRPRQPDYELVFPADWLGNWTPITGCPGIAAHDLPAYLDQPLPTSTAAAVLAVLDVHAEGFTADIDTMAADLGLQRRTLQRALDAESLSYRELLRHLRIDRAAAMLRHSDMPIAEVALRAGYSDQANFHRAFLAVFGTTPGRLRAIARGDGAAFRPDTAESAAGLVHH
jgi:AraC-like DNA-binding protein